MLSQRHVLSTRPLTTAHLAQTMSLLELNSVELRQKVEAELAHNPALELVEERRCPSCGKILRGNYPCPSCVCLQDTSSDQPIVFLSYRQDFYNSRDPDSLENDYSEDNLAPITETLAEFVLRQITPELAVQDRMIAVHILTSLDEDGLLSIPVLEISQYHHVLRSRVDHVLRLIQHADPLGVGSPTPQEALLVQLEVLSEYQKIPPNATRAIQAGIELLSPHRCVDLGHVLGIPTSQARQIVQFIGDNLNPYPARAYWGEGSIGQNQSDPSKSAYRFPDIIISRLNDKEFSPLVVEVGMPFDGTLRVNPLFREALTQAPSEKTELWQSDLERASLLVKCVQQRNHTIVRLMEVLSVIQREFILQGDAYLRPITRATLAAELTVHESTISRAVAGKAVQLPSNKIVPLSLFFDRSLPIRTALKTIINHEILPLSDNEIASMLSYQGYPVARRTVAKYRAMEGILPAHIRAHARQPQVSPVTR